MHTGGDEFLLTNQSSFNHPHPPIRHQSVVMRVRKNTQKQQACMNEYPLITQLSPSRRAVARMLATSLPTYGSLTANAISFLPVTTSRAMRSYATKKEGKFRWKETQRSVSKNGQLVTLSFWVPYRSTGGRPQENEKNGPHITPDPPHLQDDVRISSHRSAQQHQKQHRLYVGG